MSTMPTNPFYDAVRNWQRVATERITSWKARGTTLRSTFYQRFYGPQPTAMVRPLMRLRMGGMQGGQRVTGRVIPHVVRPPNAGGETYDMTYRGPMSTPPFTTQRRLGLEREPYDFTF